MASIQNILPTILACLHPPFTGIAQLALLWAHVHPRGRIFSRLPHMLKMSGRARLGAVGLAALLMTISTVMPYAHAPRDMPMIVAHDASACTTSVLQALFSQLACHWQDDGTDPFDRVLAAKGINDMTGMTEYLVSTYSEHYLRQLIDTYAWGG